jgi:hypothetical protein
MKLISNYGIGQKIMGGLNAVNLATTPLFLAPLFIADATTRAQQKLTKKLEMRPDIANALGKSREMVSGTTTSNGVMTAAPSTNLLQPPNLQPNSLRA